MTPTLAKAQVPSQQARHGHPGVPCRSPDALCPTCGDSDVLPWGGPVAWGSAVGWERSRQLPDTVGRAHPVLGLARILPVPGASFSPGIHGNHRPSGFED